MDQTYLQSLVSDILLSLRTWRWRDCTNGWARGHGPGSGGVASIENARQCLGLCESLLAALGRRKFGAILDKDGAKADQ